MGITLAVTAMLALSGCGLFDDTGVDYSGINDSEVQACAAIAMSAQLRDDSKIPSSIWVRKVVSPGIDRPADPGLLEYLVSAETHVRTDSLSVYAWTCTVTVDIDSRELTAKLTSFTLID